MCDKSYCQLDGEKLKAWELNEGDTVIVPYVDYSGRDYQFSGKVIEAVPERNRDMAKEMPIMQDVVVESTDGETISLYLDYRPIIVMAADESGRRRDYRLTTPGIHRLG